MHFTELEPRQRHQQPARVERGLAQAEGERSRYMKLIPLEEKPSADGYTKARRAKSLEGTYICIAYCCLHCFIQCWVEVQSL